jgi:hypothetical protein
MLRTLSVTLFTVRPGSCNKIDTIQRKRVLVRVVVCTVFSFSQPFRRSLHVTVTVLDEPIFRVKCFRSINEIRPTVLASKKPITNTPLRSTHPTFTSIDVMSVLYI